MPLGIGGFKPNLHRCGWGYTLDNEPLNQEVRIRVRWDVQEVLKSLRAVANGVVCVTICVTIYRKLSHFWLSPSSVWSVNTPAVDVVDSPGILGKNEVESPILSWGSNIFGSSIGLPSNSVEQPKSRSGTNWCQITSPLVSSLVSSMGGFIVLFAASLGLQVRALVSICGGADFVKTYPDRREPAAGVDRDRETLEARMEALEPITRAGAFQVESILMVHGQNDQHVPIAGHHRLFQALVPLYNDKPGECLFLTHAGDHSTPPVIENYCWEWLVEKVASTPT